MTAWFPFSEFSLRITRGPGCGRDSFLLVLFCGPSALQVTWAIFAPVTIVPLVGDRFVDPTIVGRLRGGGEAPSGNMRSLYRPQVFSSLLRCLAPLPMRTLEALNGWTAALLNAIVQVYNGFRLRRGSMSYYTRTCEE